MFLFWCAGCGGDGTGGVNYQNLTVVPGILTPTPAGSGFETVSGKVTDPLNNPLAGATVRVDGLTLNAVTNDKGEYTLWNVPGGKQKFLASKEGFIEAYNHGDVMPGQSVTVGIVLPPNSWKDPGVIEDVYNLGKQVGDYLEQQKIALKNDHQAREATIQWLKQQPLVKDASFVGNSETICYITTSGMERYIFPESFTKIDSKLSGEITYNKDFLSHPLANNTQNNSLIANSNRRALIFTPCSYEGPKWDKTGLEIFLKNAGYEVNYLDYQDITKETWEKGLSGYEVIILCTHGGLATIKPFPLPPREVVVLNTGETSGSWTNTDSEIANNYIVIDNQNVIGITPLFIDAHYYWNSFSDTRVFICEACEGLKNDSMAGTFINHGVNVYFGWTKPVNAGYASLINFTLLGSLLYGEGIIQAYNHIKQGYPRDGSIDFTAEKQAQLDYFATHLDNRPLREYNPVTSASTNYEDYSCKWINQSGHVDSNTGVCLWVNFQNTGKSTWYRDGDYPVHLGTSNPYDRHSKIYDWYAYLWLSYNRPAKLLQKFVNPGEIGTFAFFGCGINPSVKEYFCPLVENLCWLQDYGLYWELKTSRDTNVPYVFYNSVIPLANPMDDIIPIGDTGDADVTVDRKGGK